MSKFVERSRYIVIIGVFGSLVAAVMTFAWGVVRVGQFGLLLAGSFGNAPEAIVALLEIVDTFLVATVLLIVGLGLYELFVGKLTLPEWLIIDDLAKLKGKITDTLVLILAIKFTDKLMSSKNTLDLLYTAVSIAIVGSILIASNYVRSREK